MTRPVRIVAAALLLMMTAACGDGSVLEGGGQSPSSTATTEPGGETTAPPASTEPGGDDVSSTTEPPTGSTEPPTGSSESQVQGDPFSIENLLAVEAGTAPDLTGTDALIGGRPETAIAAALTAELQATGLDLTGTELQVRPITGTGESLLIMWIDDTATALGSDDTAGEVLIQTLLGSQYIEGAGITRLVINYRTVDSTGPLVLTATATIADMQHALANDEDLGEDQMLMQVTREEEQ